MFDCVLNMPITHYTNGPNLRGIFGGWRMSYYPFGVLKIEVKQVTDWIHSTIALENQ